MPDFLGFGDALARLLAKGYGERAQVTVHTEDDGKIWLFYVGPPERRDPGLANEQYRAALGTLLASLRAGGNVAYGNRDFYSRKLERLQISFWHIPPYSDVPPEEELTPLCKDWYGELIQIDEARFEAWLRALELPPVQADVAAVDGEKAPRQKVRTAKGIRER